MGADATQANGRQRILDAAIQLFGERGYAAATVRDIAKRAGTSFALIRKHFGSKEGLKDAVDDYVIESIRQSSLAEKSAVTDEYLDHIWGYAAIFTLEHPEIYKYLRRSIFEYGPSSRRLLTLYLEHHRRVAEDFASRGLLRDNVDRFWFPFLTIFTTMGPFLFESFIEDAIGDSLLDTKVYSGYKKAQRELIFKGITPD